VTELQASADSEVFPRPLNTDEERVIRALLTPEVDECATLVAQLPFVRVTRRWVSDLPSVDLEVLPGAPRAFTSERLLPTSGTVLQDNGDPGGLILVWLEDGLLAGIEYAWYTDRPPREWPVDDAIVVGLRLEG
jgi:hypothetical protein